MLKNIVIFGATGFCGRETLRQALEKGLHVTVLVRDVTKLGVRNANLKVVEGDVLSQAVVEEVVQGQDAVIQCLGIGGFGDGRPNSFVSDATKIIVSAMKDKGVRRLICMSNVGVGGSYIPWVMRKIVLPYFMKGLGLIMQDKEVMESVVTQSGLDWTIVRFPNIVEREAKGRLRISLDGRYNGLDISLTESAQFLIGQVGDITYFHKAPSISN